MSQTIPTQHPAVVLRSHYRHLRALLAIATIAIVGLTIAVVVLAGTHNRSTPIANAATAASAPTRSITIRYDGGPEEGHRELAAALAPSRVRYDGGPEEGLAGH